MSRSIANGLVDRCFIVRTGAAPAPELRPLLRDPFRPPRVAAAAALASCGVAVDDGPALLTGAEPTPPELGDGVPTLPWIERLSERHLGVLDRLPAAVCWPGPADRTAGAAWLCLAARLVRAD